MMGNFDMRSKHFKRLGLILVWQALMLVPSIDLFSPSRRWIADIFTTAALLPPFICYIAAFYDAPLFAEWPTVLKTTGLTVSSLILTWVGFITLGIIELMTEGYHFENYRFVP